MRIAYFSLDEVNRVLVRRWAARQGAGVACPNVRTIDDTPAAGLVVDLDFLPEPYRADWVGRAATDGVIGPVLVHGHGVTETEARALTRRGVTVCQGRLRRRTLRKWIGSMAALESAA